MGGRWSTMNDLDPHVLTAEREGLPEVCMEPMAGGTSKEKKEKEKEKEKNKCFLKRKSREKGIKDSYEKGA